MACYNPLRGYRDLQGKIKFRYGEHALQKDKITVPCGQCIGCRLETSRQWAVRCLHEASLHETNSFITMTYDDEHLPHDGTLVVGHWQNFAKKWRREIGPFRFFHCGEYGDQFGRPHYHAAIFGYDFAKDRDLVKVKRGNSYYQSKELDELWEKGMCIIGELTFESAAYVARYVMKKRTGKQADAYDVIDMSTGEITGRRKPEYTTMSRRPGIGAKWLDKWGSETYRDDMIIVQGKKTRPPKYYDGQWELLNKGQIASIKEKRQQQAAKHADNNTTKRLHVRKKIQELKARRLLREIQ